MEQLVKDQENWKKKGQSYNLMIFLPDSRLKTIFYVRI